MKTWQRTVRVTFGAIFIFLFVGFYLLAYHPELFMGYDPDEDYVTIEKEIICAKGKEWYIDYKSGGLLGNHECISISPNPPISALNDSSCYEFYTDEIYNIIDSLGRINIYAPSSAINEPPKKDGSIIIHKLCDYDMVTKYRIDYSERGLKRITISNSNDI